MPRLLKIPEAADHLGVSTKTVRRLIDSGALGVVRMGKTARGWRIPQAEIERFTQENLSRCPSASVAVHGSSTSSEVRAELDALLPPSPKRARLKVVSESS